MLQASFYTVTGAGYSPEGDFLLDGVKADPLEDKALVETLRAGVLCNDASFKGMDSIDGDPTEGACLYLALRLASSIYPVRMWFPLSQSKGSWPPCMKERMAQR
jgi:hypothetical protein